MSGRTFRKKIVFPNKPILLKLLNCILLELIISLRILLKNSVLKNCKIQWDFFPLISPGKNSSLKIFEKCPIYIFISREMIGKISGFFFHNYLFIVFFLH